MTIQPNMSDAGPTVIRADTKAVAGRIAPVAPPEMYSSLDDNGDFIIINQVPAHEGQIVFYRDGSEQLVTAYVVVMQERLRWVPVLVGTRINAYTGQPYDPLASFYNPLAP